MKSHRTITISDAHSKVMNVPSNWIGIVIERKVSANPIKTEGNKPFSVFRRLRTKAITALTAAINSVNIPFTGRSGPISRRNQRQKKRKRKLFRTTTAINSWLILRLSERITETIGNRKIR